MKKISNLWLMAALLCGLSLSVISCKDDDDDNNKSEEQQQEEQEAQALKFWSVVGQLVSSDDYTADYQDKTFEPTYGQAESEGSLTRIVETNDMQTAAQRFANLINVGGGSAIAIDENTESYTYDDPEVGTMTYTRGGSPNEWATVDVNIKQLPRLRKIIYRQGNEGTNAADAQKAWYRFGDVVSRTNKDGQKEYWICVRPAFVHEDKSESHWVCLNTVPTKNLYHVSGSNGTEYYVPTGIGTDKDNMQNLAEMLYAIVNPARWHDNATNYHTDGKVWGFTGVPIFIDFKKANLQYHNQYFWQNVQNAWVKNNIAELAMNTGFGLLVDRIDREGINLLYNGYSWWSSTSWNCTLNQASYTNGNSNDKKNLHLETLTEVKKNVKDIQLDCREMGEKQSNYQQFFGDTKLRWVIRHAKGKELNGGTRPAPTAQLQGGCTDVYRYYATYPNEWNRLDPKNGNGPEVSVVETEQLAEVKVGDIIGADGKFYSTKTLAETIGGGAVAMVMSLSDKAHPLEKGTTYNGIAMALAKSGTMTINEGEDYDCGLTSYVNMADYKNDLNGLATTKQLVDGCGKNHDHPAAKWCSTFASGLTAEGKARYKFSDWFLPSFGQWLISQESVGFTYPPENESNAGAITRRNDDEARFEEFLKERGVDRKTLSFTTFTCSASPRDKSYFLIGFSYIDKDFTAHQVGQGNSHIVHPFILFEY